MKRFLSLLIIIFLSVSVAYCAAPTGKYGAQLEEIEEEIYGITYSGQSDETRLARLEQSVYGSISKNSLPERLKKLSADLSADVINEKIDPSEDTFRTEEEIAEDNTVSYPALDRVETKLFSKTYDKTSLNSRIVRIEKRLFNKVYDTDDYNTRVERIKNNVFRDDYRIVSETDSQDSYYYNSNGLSSNDLSGLGRNLYNGSGLSFSDRLSSLENQLLGGSYEDDSEEERLNRLSGAYKAQKSIKKYDSNKFQQGLSTAMQVGAMILMVLCMVL